MRKRSPSRLGLDSAIKPLLSHSSTGEFNSPPEYLRIPRLRVDCRALLTNGDGIRRRERARGFRVVYSDMTLGYILVTDQSYAGHAGIFAWRTNQMQDTWVYSHDGPIGRIGTHRDGKGEEKDVHHREVLRSAPGHVADQHHSDDAEGVRQLLLQGGVHRLDRLYQIAHRAHGPRAQHLPFFAELGDAVPALHGHLLPLLRYP
eukprot:372472-Prorocentrum_minimum.AAC.1